jgi:hypothetical protein
MDDNDVWGSIPKSDFEFPEEAARELYLVVRGIARDESVIEEKEEDVRKNRKKVDDVISRQVAVYAEQKRQS